MAGDLHAEYSREYRLSGGAAWSILTGDAEKAAVLAARLGGRMREARARVGAIEVLLNQDTVFGTLVDVVYRPPRRRETTDQGKGDAESAALPLSEVGKRTCDLMAEVRAGARRRPEAALHLRIMGAEDVGVFRLASPSWEFSETVRVLATERVPGGEPERVELGISADRTTTRSGMEVSFIRPWFVVAPELNGVRWNLAA
ncbi:hypothetical protein ACFQ7A_26340 [Streptomyces sp. NPDC056528]|uniref:hypothetical protein n=1 Tax=Streptomyces sp. NPDC056528 TaxID=3345854 RepID=UPI0036CA8429